MRASITFFPLLQNAIVCLVNNKYVSALISKTGSILLVSLLCISGASAQITASISYTGGVCSDTVNFTSSVTDTPCSVGSYSWNFGDGGASTVANPSHIYAMPGIYTATLTVNDGICLDTMSVTETVTVTGQPNAGTIALSATICAGSSVTATDTAAGAWSSSAPAIASVNSTSGVVTGVSAGTATITYTVINGCGTAIAVHAVHVNPQPALITGSAGICDLATTSLSDSTTGGTWSSSNPAVATIGSAGSVTAVSAGTTLISYTISSGCARTEVFTVNILPAAISGPGTQCVGQSTQFNDLTGSGVWTSSNTTIVSVGSVTGLVTGAVAGYATISYILATGCYTTKAVTVNALPAPVAGTPNLCIGVPASFYDGSGSGTWSSTNPTVASIGTAGTVTAVAVGTAVISYTISSGCASTKAVTVSVSPSAISGPGTQCVGQSAQLSDPTGGGVWVSGNSSIASVGTAGLVTGVAAGYTTISYALGSGCAALASVTVNALPAPISGSVVCTGLPVTFYDGSGGGTWSSANPSVASIGTNGSVTAVSVGTTVISYTISSGCASTKTVSVGTPPAPISGPGTQCVSQSTQFSDATVGGEWSSTDTSVAIVDSTGVVTGVFTGIIGYATISYTLGSGCYALKSVTVNALAAPILAPPLLCTGLPATFMDGTAGGTWSSTNTSVASIGTAGNVTAVSTGTAVISYTIACGCARMDAITVNAGSSAISGPGTQCVSQSTQLSDTTAGGVWSSTNPGVASVGSTGVVSGIINGYATISYTIGNGCYALKAVTVNLLSAPMSGPSGLCLGSGGAFSDGTAGGTWTSTDPAVASISSSGGLSAVALGTTIISYAISPGCARTAVVTVNTSPSGISGPGTQCVGQSTQFTDVVSGGGWSTSNPGIATVDTAGVVTGVVNGYATIGYSLSDGCSTSKSVTVNLLAAPMSGASNVCIGTPATFLDGSIHGTWTSSNTSVATIGTTGTVTGVSAGTTVISYAISPGCARMETVTVNVPPAAISGPGTQCIGQSSQLSDVTAGGVWASSNTSIATVGSTGLVYGVLNGYATISYNLPTGCYALESVTVNLLPAPLSVPSFLCTGIPASFTDGTTGGRWVSSNTSVATIGSVSGSVTAVAVGTTVISYSTSPGCARTYTATVNMAPAPISGPGTQCVGQATQFTDTTAGGTWSTTSSTVASVGTSGTVTGGIAGYATISYTLSTGCYALESVTVNALPAPISSPPNLCTGIPATLSDGTSGGKWSSTNTSVASIGSVSGIVTAVSAGTTVISYTISSGCARMDAVTVNASPSAISGPANQCVGQSALLSDATVGGTWSSSNLTAGSVNSAGLVTGISGGYANISYTISNGCYALQAVTVNALPAPISGADSVDVAATRTLTDGSPGGAWSSAYTGIASTGTSSGVITGVATGTTIISYTSLSTGCARFVTFKVNPMGAPRLAGNGSVPLCIGDQAVLTNAIANGLWSSSDTNVAQVNAMTGVVTGISRGAATITCAALNDVGVSPNYTAVVVDGPPDVVTVASSAGNGAFAGQAVTFTAVASLLGAPWQPGGTQDHYQWEINHIPVAGATHSSFTTNSLNDNDTISVIVVTGCGAPVVADVMHAELTKVIDDAAYIQIFPNPNKGSFTVTGSPGNAAGNLSLIIRDILGQIVYTAMTPAEQGRINEIVSLPESVANGMYILNIQANNETHTYHFVVER